MTKWEKRWAVATIALAGLTLLAEAITGRMSPWEQIAWPVITVSWALRALIVSRETSRPPTVRPEPGIRLRIIDRSLGTLVDSDSRQLNYIARFGLRESPGWYELFPGDGMSYMGERRLKIEIQPVTLADMPADDD